MKNTNLLNWKGKSVGPSISNRINHEQANQTYTYNNSWQQNWKQILLYFKELGLRVDLPQRKKQQQPNHNVSE